MSQDDDAPRVIEALEAAEVLSTRTGVSASLVRGADAATGDVLRVTDAEGRLLFEHHSGTRVTVIVAPEGDLELRAPQGKVKIVAAEGVELSTPRLHAEVGEAKVEGRTLTASFDRVRQVVGVIETQAERVLERAKNVYREVEELSQTRAGRLRLVAEKTVHMLGQRTLIKAKEDVKIKGDKVYLA
ncbi:MAG: DUF3540 domain-containing protein [Myxococcales bacterium]|jgi:uncharacterized protein (DUF2345 family)|nr:DUF3540 domain-containing protein [Myxococcales bacterium]